MAQLLTPFSDVYVFEPQRYHDDRGFFEVSFNPGRFQEETGVEPRFLQDNLSESRVAGIVRGLHYQRPPFAQGKLVRCSSGRLFDAIVDIRRGSPTYGRWGGVELSVDNGRQLWIPAGYAHGFVTLEPLTQLAYKVTAPYSKADDRSIAWDDPEIGIEWPFDTATAMLSEKDAGAPRLSEAEVDFEWDGA
jgi:dTDP-4-dehydrorhamnose 3,5-epimerase